MNRVKLFDRLIETFDRGCDLVNRYDAAPHKYGEETLYQTEMHLLRYVGKHPKTTVTAIAAEMDKTVSACSQIVRKLRAKNLVRQIRNEENNREYYLELTEFGWKIFGAHDEFETGCLKRTYDYLSEFSDEELNTYLRIQEKMNETFDLDVQENLLEFDVN